MMRKVITFLHLFTLTLIPICICTVFKKELEKEVSGDTSGDFAKLLLALVQVKPHSFELNRMTRNVSV